MAGKVSDRLLALDATVLFVDIRGYTGFSEARQTEEIFHTVNRYTEMVSQLVRARGGSVVEFHGDGLLAVFGAPDEMPMKERAAVQVGCEIVAAVAIDDTTFRRAGRETCAAFMRHADLAIRGRAQPETVHTLPL